MNPHERGRQWIMISILVPWLLLQLSGWCPSSAAVSREEVERAIREGVRYLKQEQRADGSWQDVHNETRTGATSLVTLALLTAGETPDTPHVRKAVDFLRNYGPDQL